MALFSLSSSKIEIENEKEYLFELVKHKDWQISLDALELVKNFDSSYSSKIEKICLDLIEIRQKKPYVLASICGVLYKHGTTKAISLIKKIATNNSKAFVINSALDTILKIAGTEELDFVIGDGKVIDLLIKRAKGILSKTRKFNIIYGGNKPELVHILIFLTNFQDKKVTKLIDFIATKKMSFMDKTELNWFKENIKIV